MKQKMKCLGQKLKNLYGWGILISMLTGGICFFIFAAAAIIGGSFGSAVCSLVYKGFVPYLVYFTSVVVLLGFASMYLCGEHALAIDDQSDYD